ncbi:MAG: SDR family oxidoreductase [Vicinamibacterales bacterium]
MALTLVGVGCAALARRSFRKARAISFQDKTVVIVGGSRGLGLAMARLFAAEGARVVLVARDGAELTRAAEALAAFGGAAAVHACDIRNRQQVTSTIGHIADEHGTIDVLVNDAGIIEVGPVDNMNLADFEDAMATHFWGPLATIRAALPFMRQRGAKRIVNIVSIGGKVAVPHLLPYCSSKFALAGLSQGLRAELAPEGFSVTAVFPGLMRTGSTYQARFKGQHRREFAWFHTANGIPGLSMNVDRAAAQILDACRHGDSEVVLTPAARLLARAAVLMPEIVAGALSMANRLLPSPSPTGGDAAHQGWQSTSGLAPSPITQLADRATAANNQWQSVPQQEQSASPLAPRRRRRPADA